MDKGECTIDAAHADAIGSLDGAQSWMALSPLLLGGKYLCNIPLPRGTVLLANKEVTNWPMGSGRYIEGKQTQGPFVLGGKIQLNNGVPSLLHISLLLNMPYSNTVGSYKPIIQYNQARFLSSGC